MARATPADHHVHTARTFRVAEYAKWSPVNSTVSPAVATNTHREPAVWPGVCTTRTSLDICHAPPASSFTSQSFAASTASARWMTRCKAGKRAFHRSWSGQLSRCVMMSFSTPPSSSMILAKRLLYDMEMTDG